MFFVFSVSLLSLNDFLLIVLVFVFFIFRVLLIEEVLRKDWHPDVDTPYSLHHSLHSHPKDRGEDGPSEGGTESHCYHGYTESGYSSRVLSVNICLCEGGGRGRGRGLRVRVVIRLVVRIEISVDGRSHIIVVVSSAREGEKEQACLILTECFSVETSDLFTCQDTTAVSGSHPVLALSDSANPTVSQEDCKLVKLP